MTLTIGVPSKGRLQENAEAFFARAGLRLTRDRGSRGYRGGIAGLAGVEVHYLSAGDIARDLAQGKLHLGITGEDLIRETIPEADNVVELLLPLGFGAADVVIAVPAAWIDVDTVTDLDDISIAMRADEGRVPRIATKYLNLTRRYLAGYGMADFRDYRLVESSGATEGTPAAGAADLIVDITTTGATLAANGLKVLSDGVMLQSQANLVAALRADWSDTARGVLAEIVTRIEAEARGRENREVRAICAAADRMAVEAAMGTTVVVTGHDPLEVSAVVPEAETFALARRLTAAGAHSVSVRRIDYLIVPESPVLARLSQRLGQTDA